ncbi:MAG: antibiotic biosynthesis monooxygenase [Paracoccaceae bacterium]|nr:antibiotic biosynthesis monooxygenase [Paracoccaceae bacterium]
MTPVHVIAVITAKPGQRAAMLEAFQANVPNVLAEDGCITYEATTDTPDAGPIQTAFGEDTFVVIEKWASLDALKAHAAAPHMAAYAGQVKDMIAERVIHVLSPV